MSKILRPLELDDAAGFDPYYKWLAINPKEQPPNYYRLLGVSLFESDTDVIANAADARMAHVKTFQTGAHSALSQRILNEIALAKVCLLNPQQRSEYDQQLRGRLDAGKPESPPCDPAPVAVVVPTSIYSLPRRKKLPDMVFGLSLLGV
ncbi:MAG: hypothetical protein K8R46_12705, partial [Pirellulales bacterium]|nr:hypothetical protein [Pirellulales bacterium]